MFLGGSLADGQVATATGTIYTSAGTTILKSATFYNTNATGQDLNLFVTRAGGTRRQLKRHPAGSFVQFSNFNLLASGEVLVLSDGDILEANTTTATAVDYTITGAVE